MESAVNGSTFLSDANEFAESLLDLLRTSFDRGRNVASSVAKKDGKVNVTPISLAMNLVSATAAFYQECNFAEDRLRYFNEENDRIMSKIPHDAKKLDDELIKNIRILIIRAVVSMCYAGIDFNVDMEAVFGSHGVGSLVNTSKNIMSNGGLVEQGQEPSISNGHKMAPQVEICTSGVQPQSSALPQRIDMISKTLKSLLDTFTNSVDVNISGSHQIMDLTVMLQEFDRCGGYDVFEKVVKRIVDAANQGAPEERRSSSPRSPRSPRDHDMRRGVGADTSELAISPGRIRHCSSSKQLADTLRPLFKSFEDLIRIAKRLKTDYLHQVTCGKRSHRHCDLSTFLHEHHDIMGLGIMKCTPFLVPMSDPPPSNQSKSSKWAFSKPSWGSESQKTKSKKRHKRKNFAHETPSPCIASRAVQFLTDRIFSRLKPCARHVLISIDRIGVCHCLPLRTTLVPLLSALPDLQSSTQNVLLATVGRMLLQRMGLKPKQATDRKLSKSEERISTLELPNNLSTLKQSPYADEDNPQQQRFNPFDIPDSPKHKSLKSVSKYPTSRNAEIFEKLLAEDDDFTWLCLAAYKDLILPKANTPSSSLKVPVLSAEHSSLPLKVSSHLAAVAVHFDLQPIVHLLTTVIMPVLRYTTGEGDKGLSSTPEGTPKEKKHFFKRVKKTVSEQVHPRPKNPASVHTDVIANCLEILRYHLDRNGNFREVFIKHYGIQPLTFLLLKNTTCQESFKDVENPWKRISDLSASCLMTLLRSATTLSSNARILHLHEDLEDNVKSPKSSPRIKRKQEDADMVLGEAGILTNFVKGFSPLKQKSPKQKRHLSPFRGSKSPDLSQRGDSHESRIHFSWREHVVDEIKIFHTGVRFFLSSVISTITDLMKSPRDDNLGNLENGVIDLKTDPIDGRLDSEDPEPENHVSSDDEEEQSVLNLDLDNVSLPLHDFFKMQGLCNLCFLLSPILQDNAEVEETFFHLDGSDLLLRILTLVAASLIPTNANLDLTHTSSDSSSLRSFLQSVEDQAKSRTKSSDSSASKPITPISGEDGLSLPESKNLTVKSTSKMIEKEVSFGENQVLQGEEDSPENLDKMRSLKFSLLSSTLSISLLRATDSGENEFTIDDIIGSMKPLLQQSQLTSSEHCRELCISLFNAAVESEQPDILKASVSSTMSSLKQQIFSPKQARTPSPGYQRYSLSFFQCDSPSSTKKSGKRKDSLDSADLNFSEADDNSSVYDMMLNIDHDLESEDDGSVTDGYQGDSESDKHDPITFTAFGDQLKQPSTLSALVKEGTIAYPQLLLLIVQLLGDASDTVQDLTELKETSQEKVFTRQEHNDNIRAVLHTITELLKCSRDNFEKVLSACDLPLSCLESFKTILHDSREDEEDIRQTILELCLILNNHRMSPRHLRLVLSFFNSLNPPMDQLLQYLLLLIQHQHPGPSQYLQFPATGPIVTPRNTPDQEDSKSYVDEAYSLSVWRIAPLRMPLVSNIPWPATHLGVTLSLWLQVGPGQNGLRRKTKAMDSWDSGKVIVIDIDNSVKNEKNNGEQNMEITPYHHLVSIGSKPKMLQVWLEGGNLIFRVCVDPDDGRSVGVLAQTECSGIILTNGEWQHLTLNYSENKLPDKTILGKVHIISNCTTERDVILEHNVPKNADRKNNSVEAVNLFIGHWIRPVSSQFYPENVPGFKVGAVMLFEGIHFTMRSAFAIFRRGPNVNNLTDCLVSEHDMKNEKKSSASISSRIRLSRRSSHIISSASPLSPTPGLETGNNPQFFILPHSLLLSDLVTEEFFSNENMPSVRNLQEHLVLSYSPTDPAIYLSNPVNVKSHEVDRRSRSFSFFSSSPTSNSATSGESFDPLTQQSTKMSVRRHVRVKAQCNRGLHRSLNQVGGIQVFLMLCAKVVEVTAASITPFSTLEELRYAERIQCLALEALLKLRATDSKRQEEFSSLNVAGMLHKLLTKSQCIVGFRTLQILFNAACSGDEVIINLGETADEEERGILDHFEINPENSALIHDQDLLQVFLTDWQIWHKAADLTDIKDPDDRFPVWSLLLQGLLSLVRVEHPHQWFNSKSLLRAGIVHRILTGLQQMVTNEVKPFPGPSVTSHMMELFRALIGSPPSVIILSKISDFLIATHPPASTFVCHTPSSFYFNLHLHQSKTDLGHKSQPMTPVEKLSPTATDRPLFTRSASAPAKTNSPKKLLESLWSGAKEKIKEHETNGLTDSTGQGDSIHGPEDLQTRQHKALSIIEEGNSSESAHSSRNTTPSHRRSVSASRETLTLSMKSEAVNNSESSWEELPHTVNPVVRSPKKTKSPAGTPTDPVIEDINFVMRESLSKSSSKYSSLKSISSPIPDNEDELSYVMTELLKLLFMAVMTMQDVEAFELTAGPLCAKALIVSVHHKSSCVRTATLRMLAAYFSRCSEKAQEDFLKEKGFHLVANQLYQHNTTRHVVDACLYFLLGHQASSAEFLPLDGAAPDPGMLPSPAPDPFTNHAAVLLLAAMGNTTHDAILCKDVVSRLQELFECMGPIADVMLDNGLTLALCNLVTSVLKPTCFLEEHEKDEILEEIQHFMTCIAVKACVTAGAAHFNVFEDLFTLLYVIEDDQSKVASEYSAHSVARIQKISSHILMMVLELMEKSAGGKSPMVPRKLEPVVRGISLGTAPSLSSRSSYSRRSSSNHMYTASQMLARDERSIQDHDLSMSSVSITHSKAPKRQSSLMSFSQNQRSSAPRRSLSSTQNTSNESSMLFRSHAGGLRTRSFKGSQRRRINEAETARRLQRVVIIAVDKLVNKDASLGSITRNDKVTTFATAGAQPSRDPKISPYEDVFHEEHKEDFGCRLFHHLMDWLGVILHRGGTRNSRHSTSRYPPASSLTAPTSHQGWERILNISKDSLLDQAVRLFVHLISPWQGDLRLRTAPLSVVHRQNVDRILTNLIPKDSKSSKKVSIYIHYLLCYYKQQMTSSEKKDLKQFCRMFHRCGGKIFPAVQSANGVAGNDRQSRSSVSEKEVANSQVAMVADIEKSQALFDTERQRDVKIWRRQNEDAFDELQRRLGQLSQVVSQHAMDVTQQVVLRQNIERKKMTVHMKEVVSNDLSVRKQWAALLEQLAHERAVWYDEKRYPKSWQLDATEGPNRERRRLQRCHLDIAEKFMMKKSNECVLHESERKRNLQDKIREMVDNKTPEDEEQEEFKEADGDEKPIGSQKLLSKRPLSFLFEDDSHSSDSVTIRTRLQTNERISTVQSCTNVTASSETPGEVLIGESSMYFVGDEKISDLSLTQALFGECEVLVLSWRHEEVAEVHKRWWQLQDIAIEIFLTNGKTYLLAFKSGKDRDIVVKKLKDLDLPNMLLQDSDLETLTQIWRNGGMTNFEYLTQLNKSAGRSFNDLMQYPVMPFVLADYTSAILDLNNVESFRNLLRPISIPDDSRMQHYKERYKFLSDDYNNCTDDERHLRTPPFHYGSHYSNSGTVLHFLVRLPPYTQMFLEYQDASFDIPDRTFHSMETTFRLSCYSSTTDVKELVPEFFFLPEFLCNLEGFDFGIRQCGLRVNHVTLPPWSKADPRLFILINRQALESDYVSANLHGWVDLVFGFKQTGKAAVEAVNVFHPATYFGMDVSAVEDPVKRTALETMIKTYGQTPKQLFLNPHPAKNIKSEMKDQVPQGKANDGSRRSSLVPPGKPSMARQVSVKNEANRSSIISVGSKSETSRIVPPQRPLSSVLGLKWGRYLGSPSSPDPVAYLVKSLSEPVGSLIPLQTNDVCALAPKMGLLVIYNRERSVRSYKTIDIKWSALLTFGHPDNIVRLKMRKTLPDVNLFRTPVDDRITCCTVGPDCRVIAVGHRSGALIVNRCNPLPDKSFDLEFQRGTTLYGHFAEITCLVTCGEFRILASGSKDGTVVLWDLDALTYIRSLTGHATAVSAMAVSTTSGDVCTVCNSGNDEGSHIRLWTINGSLLAAQDTKLRVNCVAFSSAPEGISVNVVAGGMSNGIVRMWSSWDLTPIRDIEAQGVHNPITSLAYTHNSQVLYAATDDGYVIGWCFKNKLEDKQPILISFLNATDKS